MSSKRSNKASTGKFVLNDKTVKKLQDFFRSNVGGSYNYRQVSAYLQAQTKEEKELVKSALERLAQEKTLERVGRGKYRFHGAPATSTILPFISSLNSSLPSEVFVDTCNTL